MISCLWYESKPKCKKIQIPSKLEGACLNHFLINGSVLQYPFLNTLDLPRINQIVANDDSVLVLSESGLVFGWGGNSSGILDISSNPIASPKSIPKLGRISQISLGKSHAAAIDYEGLLYTWGCPLNNKLGYITMQKSSTPEIVLSSRVFKSIQVICGPKFTAIRTDGCYVHVYGEVGYSHEVLSKMTENKSPKSCGSYSHPELDQYSIVDICTAGNFLASLTDSGEIYIFDSCMDLVKLPVQSETQVEKIIAGEKVVWGLASSYLYQWKRPLYSKSRNYCELVSWAADVYEAPEQLQIFNWGSGFLLTGESELSEVLFELRPYKRSEYARKLFTSAMESPNVSLVKEDRVPVINFDDLERLFPCGDSQNTMEKIMKLRVEHYKREIILRAFKPLVHPIAQMAFGKIEEFAWKMHLYRKTMKVSNLVGIFNSYFKQQQSMMKLKFLWRLKALNRIHAIVTKRENVSKIEKSGEIFRNCYEVMARDVFTALRVGKPVKTIEKFRVKITGFIRKDVLISFSKWLRKVKQLKKFRKILRIFRLQILKRRFNKLKIQSEKLKIRLNQLKKLLKTKESFTKFQLKQAFGCLRSNITNTILFQFHKKYVLELFLKLITRTLSIKLYSTYTESFQSLKIFKQRKYFKTPLLQFLCQIALKTKNTAFKLLTQSTTKEIQTPLKNLLKNRFQLFLNQVHLVSSQNRLKRMAMLSITIQKILSNCLFKKKLHIFYLLQKRILSRCHSMEDFEEDALAPIYDSSSEVSKRSVSRQHLDPYFTASADVKLRPGRSSSSPNAVRRSHCCFHRSPLIHSPGLKEYRIYKGEKMTYEKYLVQRKIDELKENGLKSTLSPLNTPKKKKFINEKPPWKPASVYTHSSSTRNCHESALKKGMKYNESLRRRLMKQRLSTELSESKQSVIINEKAIISKPIKKNIPEPLNNIVSLPMCKDTLSIGLASMVIDRASKKIQKRLMKDANEMLKNIRKVSKMPAPTPIDSPKPVLLKDTLDMIKHDWQFGIIVIAADKIRMLMRKIAGKELFELIS